VRLNADIAHGKSCRPSRRLQIEPALGAGQGFQPKFSQCSPEGLQALTGFFPMLELARKNHLVSD
jgi:hypothetical protein